MWSVNDGAVKTYDGNPIHRVFGWFSAKSSLNFAGNPLRWFRGEFPQGPLITDGRNSCKWTYHCVGLPKSFILIKISGQKF